MHVTMREVAARAGVSVATVSKSLRGLASIPPSTRERIARVAAALGYRPHPYVSALMQMRRRKGLKPRAGPTLAFVTMFPTADAWQKSVSPLLRLLFEGGGERAESRGYRLQHHWLHRDGMSNQRFSEMLRARGIRGVFLTPPPQLDSRIDLVWPYFSVVAHGLSAAHPVFHRTSNDHYQSMLLTLRECRRRGYRRPGFVMDGPLSERLEHRWEAAFAIGRERMGFDARVPALLYADWDPDAVVRWVRRHRPDVMVALLFEEHVRELEARGLRIPQDLGVASLSVHQPGSAIAGIHQNARLIGAVAVDKLINLVERNETGIPADPITLTVEGRWNPGRTLRPPPGGPAPAPHHAL